MRILIVLISFVSLNVHACGVNKLKYFQNVMMQFSEDFDLKHRRAVVKICNKMLPKVKCYRRVAEKYLEEIDVTMFEMNKQLCFQMIELDKTLDKI
jgi:hypothetical protein